MNEGRWRVKTSLISTEIFFRFQEAPAWTFGISDPAFGVLATQRLHEFHGKSMEKRVGRLRTMLRNATHELLPVLSGLPHMTTWTENPSKKLHPSFKHAVHCCSPIIVWGPSWEPGLGFDSGTFNHHKELCYFPPWIKMGKSYDLHQYTVTRSPKRGWAIDHD